MSEQRTDDGHSDGGGIREGGPPVRAVGLEDLLAWYRDAGVDEALSDEPVDRYAQTERLERERSEAAAARATAAPAPAPRVPVSAPPRPRAQGAPDAAAVTEAERLAAGAADLAALRAALEGFEGCSLRHSARRLVFGAGEPGARLAVVGDVPDRDEDAEGAPFAGAAGALLDRMLGAIGVDRADAYLLTALPWRTPGQRAPNPHERATLLPFLRRHVALARPGLLLVMGGTACDMVLESRFPAARGRWHDVRTDGNNGRADETVSADGAVPALATFHPGLLLAQPQQKRLAWRDLQMLRARLSGQDAHEG